MNVLITGGAGFIGSNIAHRLVADGHTVRVLDNFSTGQLANLDGIQDSIDLIDGDIRDYWTVTAAIRDIKCVLHQAAVASVPMSVENPLSTNQVNVGGSLNVLEAARLAGVRRVVLASSSAVYGDDPTLPKKEDTPASPMSPYAVHKLINERYAAVYNDLYGLDTVCLRYFNVFGPRQDPNGDYAAVIPKFIDRLNRGQAPVVFGDGAQTRDFIYVDDCVAANLLAAEHDGIAGKVFNVAGGSQITLNQLLDCLKDTIGTEIAAQYDPPREGDILHSYASIERFAEFGFRPQVSFEEGLKRAVSFFTGGQS
jgi:UDP-glucose 4-epimerase